MEYQHKLEIDQNPIPSKAMRHLAETAINLSGGRRTYEYRKMSNLTHRSIAEVALAGVVGESSHQNNPNTFKEVAADIHDYYGSDVIENAYERFHTGLYAYVPDLVDATPILQNRKNANRSQLNKAKRSIINFNRVVREAGENHPSISYKDVCNLASHVAHRYITTERGVIGDDFNRQWPKIQRSIENIVQGARHEVAFSEIMHQLRKTYDYREGTPEEDLKGIDYVITRKDDGARINVDVKASRGAVENASYHSNDTLVLATGLTDDDFPQGGMVARISAIKRQAPIISAALELGLSNLSRFQRTGRSAAYQAARPRYQAGARTRYR